MTPDFEDRPAPAPAPANPSGRYAALNVASIALAVGGLGLVIAISRTVPDIFSGELSLLDATRATWILVGLVVGALALVVGLVANAVRAIVVRETLPPWRYRGPSIVVLWLLATVAANLAIVSAAADASTLLSGGEPSVYGALVTLTVTQAGLLGTAWLLVYVPRALAGLRLVPRTGLWRSLLIGFGLAIPSWIAAQLIGYLVVVILEPLGLRPETGIAELALANADPYVLVFALVVFAPIAEEIFFRGVAFNAWEREYGTRRAVWGSAVLFAVIHGSIFFIPSILALGFVLALVYRGTRSLPATIVLHATFNGITLGLSLLARYDVLKIPVT